MILHNQVRTFRPFPSCHELEYGWIENVNSAILPQKVGPA